MRLRRNSELLFDMTAQIERERDEQRCTEVALSEVKEKDKEGEEFLDEEIASTCGPGADSTSAAASAELRCIDSRTSGAEQR
jgi:hypothetical protein